MRAFAALAAALCCLAFAAPASARSVTLTSPTNGQTFYTGNGAIAGVPYAAVRDRSSCFQGVSVWRIERDSPTDTLGYLGIVQTTEESMSQTVGTFLGTYTVRARFLCNIDDWVESPPVTIHVVAGNPPSGGGDGLAEIEAKLRENCAKQRDVLGVFARLARQQRDTLPVLDYVARFSERSSIAFGGIAFGMNRTFAGRPYAKLIKIGADLLKYESNVAKILHRDTRARIKELDAEIASTLASYRTSCAKYESPDISGAGAEKLKIPGGKPAAARGKVGTGRLSALLRSQRRAFKSNRTEQMAGLVRESTALRLALAPRGLMHHVRLALRDLPKRVRREGWTARYVGKSASKLLSDPALAKAERRLAAVLRAQP